MMESVHHFCKVMMCVYGLMYLRAPNEEDTIRLMQMNAKRSWQGMLGSANCMHWKNCSKTWQWHYYGKSHDPTIVLEAVALEDLWIWH
jgi:hypothetical protein